MRSNGIMFIYQKWSCPEFCGPNISHGQHSRWFAECYCKLCILKFWGVVYFQINKQKRSKLALPYSVRGQPFSFSQLSFKSVKLLLNQFYILFQRNIPPKPLKLVSSLSLSLFLSLSLSLSISLSLHISLSPYLYIPLFSWKESKLKILYCSQVLNLQPNTSQSRELTARQVKPRNMLPVC